MIEYRKDVDALRGYAVLAVVFTILIFLILEAVLLV